MTQNNPHDNDHNRHTDEELRLFVDSARDFAMIFQDPDRRIMRWSRGAEHLLGWTAQEAVGQSGDMIFTEEDRQAGAPEQEQKTAVREGRAEDERWHVRKDGSLFWASGVMTPLYEPATGKLRGFGKVLRDLTQRKRMEDELLQANEDLEAKVAERTAQQRELSRQLVTRVEEERRRLSRELHDQTGQHLAALGMELGMMERDAARIRDAARTAAGLASSAAQVASDAAQAAHSAAISAAAPDASPEICRLAQVASEAARVAAIASTDARAAAVSAEAAVAVVTEAAPRLAQMRELNEALSRDVHRIAVDLRPTSLDDLGLVTSLQAYVDTWSQRTGIPTQIQSVGLEESGDAARRLLPEVEITVYRIVQEALTNVAKHGTGTKQVGITLQRVDGQVLVTVEDDGPGFDRDTAGAGRLGLAGMRERATQIGGTLDIEAEPGSGTTIFARLPLQPRQPDSLP